MKILLIGHRGQLAHELQRSLSCLGGVISLGRSTTPPLDLQRPSLIRPLIEALSPDLIVNAAAHTRVDQAETEPEQAFRLNHECVAELARTAAEQKIPLIHYSTDYVFDGEATRPYQETDLTHPLGVYGQSKWAGEEAIRAAGGCHLILRTAWVYGLHGQNFLNTMLRLMTERQELGIVDDQIGAPTWSRQIADATALCAFRWLEEPSFKAQHSGTYHLTSQGSTSWFGFASEIQRLGRLSGLLSETSAALRPLGTVDYPTPARRPPYSVLDSTRLKETFGVRIPDWTEGLALCLDPSEGRPQDRGT